MVAWLCLVDEQNNLRIISRFYLILLNYFYSIYKSNNQMATLEKALEKKKNNHVQFDPSGTMLLE